MLCLRTLLFLIALKAQLVLQTDTIFNSPYFIIYKRLHLYVVFIPAMKRAEFDAVTTYVLVIPAMTSYFVIGLLLVITITNRFPVRMDASPCFVCVLFFHIDRVGGDRASAFDIIFIILCVILHN